MSTKPRPAGGEQGIAALDGHMQGFRKEPEFPPFFAKVKPFFDQICEMRHYVLTDVVKPPL